MNDRWFFGLLLFFMWACSWVLIELVVDGVVKELQHIHLYHHLDIDMELIPSLPSGQSTRVEARA